MYYYKSIFLSLFLLLPFFLSAQIANPITYTDNNGLPSSEVFHVIQDKKGFVWFATNEGVSQFNGYSFKNFTNIEGLADNTILELYEDYKGRIWFISISGRLSWYENDSIHKFKYNSLIINKLEDSAYPIKRSFYIDSTDNIYFGFYNNHLLKITSSGEIIELDDSRNASNIVFFDNQLLYNYRNLVNKVVVSLNCSNSENITIKTRKKPYIRAFAHHHQNHILYSEYKTLYIVDSIGNFRKVDFKEEIIWISSDSNGLIWIGFLKNGAVAFNDLSFTSKAFHLAANSSVSSVLRDSEDSFWITTLEDGILYYPSLDIKHITKQNFEGNPSTNEFTINNEKIYFGGSGLEYYEFDQNNIKTYNLNITQKPVDCKLLQWIGDTLVIGNSLLGTYLVYRNKIINYNEACYRIVLKISRDSLIFVSSNNIRYFNKKKITRHEKINGVSDIYDAIRLNDSIILLGTDIGLVSFNYRTRGYKKDNRFNELNSRINTLLLEGDNIWIGTKGSGLLKLNNERLYKYSIKDGLPGNSITSIVKSDSTIFLGTNNGIAKVSFNDFNKIQNITLLNTGHGLITNGIKDIAVLGNTLFIGTSKGVSYLNKEIDGKPSHIYITNFKVASRDTTLMKDYKLNHNQNFIEISFVALNFKRNKPIQYFYKLEGVDKEWQKTEDLSVRYALLPPGSYKFKVQAINSFGKYSAEPASITFSIKKALRQTVLFKVAIILISLLIASVLAFTILRIKIAEIRKRNDLESELNKYRQKALSAQMNPHFIFNSLNSIQSYILKNDLIKSSEYLSKFGNLMRRVLNNSQNSAITLDEELDALKLYIDLELTRFKNGFSYQLIIDNNININEMKVPPLILQPFVENAIHHGLRQKDGAKELKVRLLKKDDRIKIHIEDNGIGLEESKQVNKNKKNRSYGTYITNKRLNLYSSLYNNDIQISMIDLSDNKTGETGTRVEIEFKVLASKSV